MELETISVASLFPAPGHPHTHGSVTLRTPRGGSCVSPGLNLSSGSLLPEHGTCSVNRTSGGVGETTVVTSVLGRNCMISFLAKARSGLGQKQEQVALGTVPAEAGGCSLCSERDCWRVDLPDRGHEVFFPLVPILSLCL